MHSVNNRKLVTALCHNRKSHQNEHAAFVLQSTETFILCYTARVVQPIRYKHL